MKLHFLLFIFILSLKTYACNEVGTVRFLNSDNSIGGLVGPKTKVHPNAYIGFSAKVCENAWVEDGAIITDHSTVSGNAWVKEFSTISGNASIFGNSVIWGTKNSPVLVSGNSKIYENAKLLTGTSATDNSLVYGNVVIRDSQISGDAKICESLSLTSLNITDDNFCFPETSISNLETNLLNVKTKVFNAPINIVRIKSSGSNFLTDPSVYRITWNDIEVPIESLVKIYGTEIQIDITDLRVEGQNVVSITGRDEYNRSFETVSYKLVFGSGEKIIDLENAEIATDQFKTSIKHFFNGEEFNGRGYVEGSAVHIKNVPMSSIDYETEVKIVGKKYFLAERISGDISSLQLVKYPDFINNENNFEDNLQSWKLSHPQNVEIDESGNKKIVKVFGDSSSRVELSKRFRIQNKDVGILLNSVLPMLSNLILDASPVIDIMFISLNDQTMSWKRYEGSLESKEVSDIGKSKPNNEMIVYIRMNPSVSLAYPLTPLLLVSLSRQDVLIAFSPYQLNAKNIEASPNFPSTGTSDCSNPIYNIQSNSNFNIGPYTDNPHERLIQDEFNYFSAGDSWSMRPEVTENRIFAYYTLVANDPSYHIIENPTLLIVQDGDVKKEIGLSTCVKNELNNQDYKDSYPLTKNLVKYMFQIPFDSASQSMNLNTNPGSRVSLFLKAKIGNGGNTFYKLSNEINVPILVALPVERNYWYGVVEPKGLDHYNSNKKGMLRTAGDKWIVPYHKETISNLVWTTAVGWRINDFSKVNGGPFPGHESHVNGLDGDLSTDGFPLGKDYNSTSWNNILKKIEDFLIVNQSKFDVIDTFFISRTKAATTSYPWSYDESFLESQFKNRCLGDDPRKKRYISFHPNDKAKSLLQHENGHFDHIHIRFHEVSLYSGIPISHESDPVELDLEDLIFELVEESNGNSVIKKIKITPRNLSQFPEEVRILWRLQESESFNDVDNRGSIQYGRYQKASQQKVIIEESNIAKLYQRETSNHYLFVTIADSLMGNCSQTQVNLDFKNLKKNTRWTFEKDGSKFKYREL